MEQNRRRNRLSREKSPYLLQHAGNPVEWYPWCTEAFAQAKAQDKPVFLSIGYSTCHWCHVMARESFENGEIAALLNSSFVAVKVDREERPDIDAVYMSVCQALTGGGGWPLNLLLTPDQKPFWAGTYLPRHGQQGRMGLYELLEEASRMWREQREALLQTSSALANHLEQQSAPQKAQPFEQLIEEAVEIFKSGFDSKNGGFGRAPKFPTPHNLIFLLRYAQIRKDAQALRMAETTLQQMARGGIFDHIGGGFSRYSTDERWLAPHFEKMLYDNALLAYAYLEAFEQTGKELYRQTAVDTLDYVLRELTGKEGEFYCGQDADSDGIEGKYYTFTQTEIKDVLGNDEGDRFCRWYDITGKGNFEGKNIPNLLNHNDWQKSHELGACRKKLYEYRMRRTALQQDDKVLTAWNALMIAALAKAARVLDDGRYLRAARRALRFIAENLTDQQGRLYVRWRDGQAAYTGQLDDYAFLTWALLELYACTFEAELLQKAAALTQMADSWFADEQGGFYLYASDAERLITRPKELYDGAMPSGNSVMAMNLVKLKSLTGEKRWKQRADRQLTYAAGSITSYPAGYSFSLLAMLQDMTPCGTIVCALAEPMPEGLRELLLSSNAGVIVKTRSNAALLSSVAPLTDVYPVPETGEVYYFCKEGACFPPVHDLEALRRQLN